MTSDPAQSHSERDLLAQMDALFDLLAEHDESQQLDCLEALADRFPPKAVAAVRRLLHGLARHGAFFEQPAAQRVSLDRPYAVGESLGRWRVDGELGRGGQAIALAVSRLEGGFEQQAVLKMPLNTPPSPDTVRRMLRERQMLASLKHPGLPSMIDGGVLEDGAPYFVIERIAGRPIDEYANSQRLSLRDRVALLRKVAGIVAYAHAQLVLHRDIKPANILIDSDGRVVLLDFGVAQSLHANATATNVGYTLAFAAPEQVRGERSTAATDVYGLAALACRLLGGEGPFPGLQASAQVRAVLEFTPQLPAGLDRDLAAILQRAMRKEPQARYASVAEFDAELARWQLHLPVLAHSGGKRYRMGKWLRRWRVAVAVATILLVITASALWQRKQAQQEATNALAVKNFVLRVFTGANRWTTGRDVSALELAQRGFYEVESLENPRAKFELYTTLAAVFGRNQPQRYSLMASEKRMALMDQIGLSRKEQLQVTLDHLNFLWWAERLSEVHSQIDSVQSRYANELSNDPFARLQIDTLQMNLAKGEQNFAQLRKINTPAFLTRQQRTFEPSGIGMSETYYYGNRSFAAWREFNYRELFAQLPSFVRAMQRYGTADANSGLAAGTAAMLLKRLLPNSETERVSARALRWCYDYFGKVSTYCDGLHEIELGQRVHAAEWPQAEKLYAQRLAINSRYPEESIVELQPIYYAGAVIALARGDFSVAADRAEHAQALAISVCGAESHCTRATHAIQLQIAGTQKARTELRGLATLQIDKDDPQSWRSWLWLAQNAIAEKDRPSARADLRKAGDWLHAHGSPLQGDMVALYQQLDLIAPADPVYEVLTILPQIEQILSAAEKLQQDKARLAPQSDGAGSQP